MRKKRVEWLQTRQMKAKRIIAIKRRRRWWKKINANKPRLKTGDYTTVAKPRTRKLQDITTIKYLRTIERKLSTKQEKIKKKINTSFSESTKRWKWNRTVIIGFTNIRPEMNINRKEILLKIKNG